MAHVANSADSFNASVGVGSRLGLVGAYRRHGWFGLHPVIPPGVMPDLGGKCPGVMDGSGGWHPVGVQRAGFYDELSDAGCRLSHEARRAWGNGAGIGVNARWFPALDVDVLDELASAALRGFLRDVYGAGCFLRVGRWPKFLMPFALAEGLTGLRKHRWTVEGGAIELLGWGQQWVAEGIHGGTGRGYSWLGFEGALEGAGGTGRPVVERLPVLGLEALGELVGAMLRVVGGRRHRVRIGERVEAPARPMAELAGPEEVAVEVLAAWPNGLGVSYETYVAVAHALWGASGGGSLWDGWGLFSRWARRHPRWDAGKDARTWGSIRGSRVGVEWLVGAVPGTDESEAARRRRPGRGAGGGGVTAGVRAGWMMRVAAWRVEQSAGVGVAGTGDVAGEEAV